MTSQTAAIIRAHLGSSRLPGKIMLPAAGRPLLSHLIERLSRVPDIDLTILATTEMHCDKVLEDFAAREGIACFRGSNDDVMSRVLAAAEHYSVDTIIDVTSDCPLADPETVTRVIACLREGGLDYASNILKRTYPRGFDAQAYTREALARARSATDDATDREHVTLFMYENPDIFKLGNVTAPAALAREDCRLTLDTPEDYFVLRAVFEALLPENPNFAYADVLAFLDAHPEIAALNRDIVQKKPRAYDHTEKARQALGLS